MMRSFSKRSRQNLQKVHPDLIMIVSRALLYSEYDFAVSEGMRTSDRQWKLFNAGFSKTLRSKHLQQSDGYAHAVDLVAVGDLDQDGDVDSQDRNRTWSKDVYTKIAEAMKRAADECGVAIRWGGEFKNFFDGPHFELKEE